VVNMKKEFIYLVAIAIATPAQAAPSLMDQRIQSAQALIADINHFKNQAQQIHNQAEYVIVQAKQLKGEASKLEITAPAIKGNVKMNNTELQSAKQQYNSDVKEFAEHAKAYNQHLQDFQKLVGECHASNKAVADILQKYELHVTQFHTPMPNIRPPHICVGLQERMGNMSSVARQMMGDQIRVMQSEAKLNQERQGMEMANGAAVNLQTKAMLTAERAQGETQLASEFGRLKEEYDLLNTEKDTIDGVMTNTKLTQASVSGKVMPKNK